MINTIRQSFSRRAYNMKRNFLRYLEETNAKNHEQDVVDVLNRVFKNRRIPYIAKNEQQLNKKTLVEINNYKCDFSIYKRGSKTLTWGEIKFSKKYRPFNLQFVIKNLSMDNFKTDPNKFNYELTIPKRSKKDININDNSVIGEIADKSVNDNINNILKIISESIKQSKFHEWYFTEFKDYVLENKTNITSMDFQTYGNLVMLSWWKKCGVKKLCQFDIDNTGEQCQKYYISKGANYIVLDKNLYLLRKEYDPLKLYELLINISDLKNIPDISEVLQHSIARVVMEEVGTRNRPYRLRLWIDLDENSINQTNYNKGIPIFELENEYEKNI